MQRELYTVSKRGDLQTVRRLIERGVDVNKCQEVSEDLPSSFSVFIDSLVAIVLATELSTLSSRTRTGRPYIEISLPFWSQSVCIPLSPLSGWVDSTPQCELRGHSGVVSSLLRSGANIHEVTTVRGRN